jgi:methionyl-tRNA synthetase
LSITSCFDGNVFLTNEVNGLDNELLLLKNNLKNSVDEKMNELQVSLALEDIFEVLRRANKYIDETEPWVLAKDDSNKDRLEQVIYNLLDVIRVCAIILQPFIPGTSDEIFLQLGISEKALEDIDKEYEYHVGEAKILFKRIDTKKSVL